MYILSPLNGVIMPKKISTDTTNKEVEEVVEETAPVAAHKSTPVKTEAQKIWDEIQNLPILMFGLPDQTVAMHCSPMAVEPSKLYLITRSSATLPSLESSIGKGFTVELADKFVIVARAPKPLIPSKK
jgi:hypothetical protein